MNVWRGRLQRWFTPLAARCPLSPNTITILAVALNIVAAVMFYERLFIFAIWVVAVAGLADAFDGIVARVQNKSSRYGDFLDHFGDRVSDTLLLAGWLLGNAVRVELTVLSMIAVGLNGYIGTQLEATWREREYDTVGRGEFVLALIVFPIISHILYANGWNAIRFRGFIVAEWLAFAIIAFALFGIGQRVGVASRLEKS
jgi:phosphatidylglycerophosphate synthase